LSNKELAALVSDQAERTAALNFLLGSGLLKPLQYSGGKLFFRAVVKQELEMYVLLIRVVVQKWLMATYF
jgi:DNA-directed RNA polymerase III subunit RPC6